LIFGFEGYTPGVFRESGKVFGMLRLAEMGERGMGKSVEVLADEAVARRIVSMDVRLWEVGV
jgi:hypothetical protein